MSQVNITLNTNTVDINTTNNQIVVTDPINPNVVNITQPVTSIVEVITAGPQGSTGPSGSSVNTGSFVTTSSFNAYTGSSTSQFAGTASYALTASYAMNAGGSGAGFPYSGSAVITGSLLVSGSTTITGSLEVSGSITGSLFGTASSALSSSYALSSSLAATASFARYPYITVITTGNTPAGSLPNTDYIYLVNGAHTVTLPNAVGNTSRYDIKNIGTGIATIATTLAQTIDTTTASITLPVRYTSLTIVSNGTNWNII